MTQSGRLGVLALAVAGLLAACGGGSDGDTGPAHAPSDQTVEAAKVIVVGDSLADSGTFGYKFTVQGSDAQGQSFLLWPEIVAGRYNGSTLCAHYRSSDDTMATYTEVADCRNYAVGGARVQPLDAKFQPVVSPLAIGEQLKQAAKQGFAKHDLLLADGGANDVAALITAFIESVVASDYSGFLGMAGSLIDAQTLDTLVQKGEAGIAEIGALYMQKLGQQMVAAVQREALDQGAQRVVVLNIPDVTKTPRLMGVLELISLVVDKEKLAALTQMFDSWTQAYNATLAQAWKQEARVVVSDFYTNLSHQVANPAQYGYTNVSSAACAVLASVPDARLDLCTAALLSANIPAGQTGANWWQSYMFSNTFHPSPLGYQLMGEFVWKDMADKGWSAAR